MTKYIVKALHDPSRGLHSYYTVSTREEANRIAKQYIRAEITEEKQDEEV